MVQGINCANNFVRRDGLVLNDIKTLLQNFNTWKAVVLGVQLGVIYMELEGDAKVVVQGINCANNSVGRDGLVLNDIKTLLQNFNT